jgi:hypothetical protein
MIKRARWFISITEDGMARLRNSKGSTYWCTPDGIWLTGHNKRRVASNAVIVRLERARAMAVVKAGG